MIVVGLTGGIATGKTTVLNIFKKLGYSTISCDEVYHKLLKKNNKLKKKLINIFGKDILWRNKVSTKRLYKKLVEDVNNIYILEKITHPFILKEVFRQVQKYKKSSKYDLCVVDVPLLFEIKIEDKFDYVITVSCSKKIQKERLKKRKVGKRLLELPLSRQMTIKEKIKLSDFVIHNDNIPKTLLKLQIDKIVQQLLTN